MPQGVLTFSSRLAGSQVATHDLADLGPPPGFGSFRVFLTQVIPSPPDNSYANITLNSLTTTTDAAPLPETVRTAAALARRMEISPRTARRYIAAGMPGNPTDGYIVGDCEAWRTIRNAPTPAQIRKQENAELSAMLDEILAEMKAAEE